MIEEVLISKEQIEERVAQIGAQISKDYEGKPILMVCVLKGATPFFADLIRNIKGDVEIDFIQASSYGGGTTSSGTVTIRKDLDSDIAGKNVILVEDIVDSGLTLSNLCKLLEERKPASIKVASFLDKPSRRQVEFVPDYCGFTVEDKFIIGYGLDLDQKYRELPYVSWVKEV